MAVESGRGDDRAAGTLEIDSAPQLFLGDFVVDGREGLERRVEPPERPKEPGLDSATFGRPQPYVTVFNDRESLRFRLWH
jgi:hypothetical protein